MAMRDCDKPVTRFEFDDLKERLEKAEKKNRKFEDYMLAHKTFYAIICAISTGIFFIVQHWNDFKIALFDIGGGR